MTHTVAHIIPSRQTANDLKAQACEELRMRAHIPVNPNLPPTIAKRLSQPVEIKGITNDTFLVGFNENGEIIVYESNDRPIDKDCNCESVLKEIENKNSNVLHVRTVTFIVYEASPARVCFVDSGQVICRP